MLWATARVCPGFLVPAVACAPNPSAVEDDTVALVVRAFKAQITLATCAVNLAGATVPCDIHTLEHIAADAAASASASQRVRERLPWVGCYEVDLPEIARTL